MATQSCPAFLPGESRGQRNRAGYSSWGRKESDTTEDTRAHTRSPWTVKSPTYKARERLEIFRLPISPGSLEM